MVYGEAAITRQSSKGQAVKRAPAKPKKGGSGKAPAAHGNMSLEFDQISNQIPIVMWTTDRDLNFTSIAGGGVLELERSRQSDHPPASLFELFQTN